MAARMCRMMGVVSRGPVYYDLFEEFAALATNGMCPIGAPDERGHKDGWPIQQLSTSPTQQPTCLSPCGVLRLGRRSRFSRRRGLVGPTACRLSARPYRGGSAVSATRAVRYVRGGSPTASKILDIPSTPVQNPSARRND